MSKYELESELHSKNKSGSAQCSIFGCPLPLESINLGKLNILKGYFVALVELATNGPYASIASIPAV